MSMIYECPHCHTPQAPGHTSCHHCGSEFDGPVPDDAVLPEADSVSEEPQQMLVTMPARQVSPLSEEHSEPATNETDVPSLDATTVDEAATVESEREPTAPLNIEAATSLEPEPTAQDVVPAAPKKRVYNPEPSEPEEDYSPPPVLDEELPYQSSPYPASTYQPQPTYGEAPVYTTKPPPRRNSLGTLPKALLIAFPIVLIVVLGCVMFARSLDSGQDTSPTPLPAPVTTAPSFKPVPIGSPLVLNGASGGSSVDGNPKAKRMVGRWQTKSTDYYEFDENGTGSRGTVAGKQAQGTFLWVLVQNQLILYADKQEKLAFSEGPDDNTMFLRGEDGKYVQYSRIKS